MERRAILILLLSYLPNFAPDSFNILFFYRTPEDVALCKTRNVTVALGQVALRCRHCTCISVAFRPKGSLLVANMHRSLYKHFNNGTNNHVEDICPFVPGATKKKLGRLRMHNLFRGEISFWEDLGYWCSLAKDEGVVETNEGLRFKTSLIIAKNNALGYSHHNTKALPNPVHQDNSEAIVGEIRSPLASKAPPMNMSNRRVRAHWTQEEDKLLLEAIGNESDHFCWSAIAQGIPRRTGKDCRERYLNHLKYNLKQSGWTASEDDMIFRLFESIGSKWSEMTQFLPGRTDNGIKNRYHHLGKFNKKRDKFEQLTQYEIQQSTLQPALQRVHLTTQKENKPLKRKRCQSIEQRLDLSEKQASKKAKSMVEQVLAVTATATKRCNESHQSMLVKSTRQQIEEACTTRKQEALHTWFRRLQDFINYTIRNGHGKFCFSLPRSCTFLRDSL